MNIFKILAILIIAAILALVLRQYKPEFSIVIIIFTATFIMIVILKSLFSPINSIIEKIENNGIEIKYFKIAVKAIGIGYVTDFAANLCKDAGQSALSSLAETVGNCSIFLLSIPLIFNLLNLTLEFIK